MRGFALAGLAATMVAVLVLLGSMIFGIGSGAVEVAPDSEPGVTVPERRIRVQVLNAAGIPRLAQRGTDRLRDRGFDVVHYGNAHGFHPDTSLVLDRVGDPEATRAVARAVGVSRVRTVRDSTLYLEVTVILGRDWQGVLEEELPID